MTSRFREKESKQTNRQLITSRMLSTTQVAAGKDGTELHFCLRNHKHRAFGIHSADSRFVTKLDLIATLVNLKK